MELVDVATLYPLLRRHISGPLDDMMRDALVSSAIRFCRDSRFLVDVTTILNVKAGVAVNVSQTTGIKASDLNRVLDDKGMPLQGGVDYFVPSANQIIPQWDFAAISIGFCAEPIRSATALPAPLLDDYAETIVCGALVALFLKPNQIWSSADQAQVYEAQFTDGCRRATRFRLEQSRDPVQSDFENPGRAHHFY